MKPARITVGIAAGMLVLSAPGIASATASSSARTAAVAPAGVINHSCGPNQDPNKLRYHDRNDAEHTTIGSARISLREGQNSAHKGYMWARITSGSVGNTVWLDWADVAWDTTPRSWHECGPYKIHNGHDAHTLAVNAVSNDWGTRVFRACGHHAGKTKCTRWSRA